MRGNGTRAERDCRTDKRPSVGQRYISFSEMAGILRIVDPWDRFGRARVKKLRRSYIMPPTSNPVGAGKSYSQKTDGTKYKKRCKQAPSYKRPESLSFSDRARA